MKGRLPIVAVLLALFTGTVDVRAGESVRCEILTIQASNTGQGIDPALRAHRSLFLQAPFSSYNTFRLVNRHIHTMALGVHKSLTLPPSLTGSLRLNRIDGAKLDLTLTLTRQGREPIRINGKASPGSPFFAAGLKNTQGVWIFGVVCHRDGIVHH
ncbi:MAG: hypothetical protein QNJ97_17435 [Myxococcota bacterium]|nr:hypothetical protein [Myxococcota bacterium]